MVVVTITQSWPACGVLHAAPSASTCRAVEAFEPELFPSHKGEAYLRPYIIVKGSFASQLLTSQACEEFIMTKFTRKFSVHTSWACNSGRLVVRSFRICDIIICYARMHNGFVWLSRLAVVSFCVLRCPRHAVTMRGGASKSLVIFLLLLAVSAAAQQQQSVLLPESPVQVGPSRCQH
jgi:hypothetical protein